VRSADADGLAVGLRVRFRARDLGFALRRIRRQVVLLRVGRRLRLLLLRLAARERLSWTQVVVGGVSTSVVLAVVPCACFLAYNDGLFDWWSLYSIKL